MFSNTSMLPSRSLFMRLVGIKSNPDGKQWQMLCMGRAIARRANSIEVEWPSRAGGQAWKPYWQGGICKHHIQPAAQKAGLGGNVGWHTFRHTYRTWLDSTGAPVSMQRELMRHASIQTTMNVYGRATMSEAKRQANSKVVRLALKPFMPGKNASESEGFSA